VQYLSNIDPPAVIAWRLVLMLVLGLALPQVSGLLISRIASGRTLFRVLGTLIPGLVFAAVIFNAVQADAATMKTAGIRQVCLTPAFSAVVLLVPAHCFIAAALQNALRTRAATDTRRVP